MNEFWEKINKPVPFYTENNIRESIIFAENNARSYTNFYINVLKWVLARLKESVCIVQPNHRFIAAGLEAAGEEHDKALVKRQFAEAVRWLYIKTAIRDFNIVVRKVV